MVKSLLDAEDAKRVEQRVAEVERQTASEIVVGVVPRSAEYWQWRVIASGGWALATALAAALWLPWLDPILIIVLEPLLAVLLFVFLGIPAIRRRMIPPDAAELAVRTRAFALFSERGVHRTRDRTGLLIFISELEHKVVILGDIGLHERVGEQGWAEHVQYLVERIRQGRARDGLLETIDRFAGILAERVPRRADDTNELPDSIVRG